MAKPNNAEARRMVDEDYNGTRNGSLFELNYYGGNSVDWDYYDTTKKVIIRDKNGNTITTTWW